MDCYLLVAKIQKYWHMIIEHKVQLLSNFKGIEVKFVDSSMIPVV